MSRMSRFSPDAEVSTCIGIERLKSSSMGNPRYSITLDDGSGAYLQLPTVPNASDAYAITDAWIGQQVRTDYSVYRGRPCISRIELAA